MSVSSSRQWFLLLVLEQHPPPTLTTAKRDAAVSKVRGTQNLSKGVLTVLKRVVAMYHPDKNRPEAVSAQGAVRAEEIAKMITLVHSKLASSYPYSTM